MRYSVFLTLLVSFFLTSADAQVKRGGGLFGFGGNDEDQISSDLFPAPATSETPIFRGGEPEPIDEVSYVIENGEKIEKEVDSKRKGFLSFGKKADKAADDVIEAVPVIPAPSYPDPTSATIATPSPPAAPAIVETTVAETSTAVMEAVNEPVEEAKKKSGGLFSFFGKKDDEIPDAPTMLETGAEEIVTEVTTTVAEANPYQAPAPATTTAAPTTTTVTPVAADPVPQFAGMEEEKEGFSLPNPLAKMRNQKEEKTIDLTGAETIIQNGEIVGETEDIVESNKVQTTSGERQPPRIVNGVKTYSSWDDVDARSVSAADKILNQMR